MLSIYQLRMYAKKFLKETYGMEMEIPLELNGRLKRTCGWFRHTRYADGRDIAKAIELNKFFVENNEPTVVLDVLRHELVHYAMFVQKKSYKDGEYGFERELKRLGVVSQDTINKYNIESKPVKVHMYKCDRCTNVFRRQKALPNGGKNHRCSCKGNLIDLGKKVVTT